MLESKFTWKYNDAFIFSIMDDSDRNIPVSRWNEIKPEHLTQLSILNELHDNGFADFTNDNCEVETADILNLSDIDKKILSLPEHYPYDIYVQSVGQLNQPKFKFKYGFFDFVPNGTRLASERTGAIVGMENGNYLLSANQHKVCEAIDEFNALPETERTFAQNLRCFSDIKGFSQSAAVLLDGYLNNENVYQPDKIKIDLNYENDILEIVPNIGNVDTNGFVQRFDIFQDVKDVYPVSNRDGTTTRIVVDEKQINELKKIKLKRKITKKEEIEEIVEHPELYFDDETLDISVFYSERVKEIGVYKPKFYPFVCPYKSEWIPGIVIKDKVLGEKRVHFKSSDELKDFEDDLISAKEKNSSTVTWKGEQIPLEDAIKFITIAKRQFANPKMPVIEAGEKKEDEVLIIKENAEFLEYAEDKNQPESIEHNFSKIGNLDASIELKEHQVEGIAWLQSLHNEKLGGCLLADDMGLGKTLQLLYFIEWHSQNHDHDKPYLIVAPVTLLENWENEYKKFFSPQTLPITLLYGSVGMPKAFDKRHVEELQKKHIILTNYETLRTYQLNLCAVDYAVVVLDEAQKIKTPGTLVTNVSKALKADFKIAMTGTPVENTLVDLWCIMDYSVPGLLGNAKDFAKEYQNPMKEEKTDVKELGERLRRQIGIFIKRRLKKDVAKDLPNKFDDENSKIKKQMPKVQLERYKNEIEQAKNSEVTGVEKRNQILKSLWAIRDISDHPYLVERQLSGIPSDELISSSAKLQVLVDILLDVQVKDEKAIVFADRKETQKMLQQVIRDRFEIGASIVNGDTPSTKNEGRAKLSRQQTIDRFQTKDGFNVIVMSQLAAGVGLNVSLANHVIHYTRHWNPAKEEQATDRAYRIGQKRDVHVYYPMAVSEEFKSFDLILDELLRRKKLLASHTLFPSEQAEVRPDEIFADVFGINAESKHTPLTMREIDSLNPNLFEAFIAALYSKKGFVTYLTPYSNDKGVDVVAIRDGECYLLQAKQSKYVIGNDAVREIYTAKNYYEIKFRETFSLVVISNNYFSTSADILSMTNQVKLVNRSAFEKWVEEAGVTLQEMNKQESQRMTVV
jgi:SNF2 family DNA or RNA helicase/HJR/Mrr/RecB family endonuclease